jgi:tRNA 2-thiouridine synthesizing protein E
MPKKRKAPTAAQRKAAPRATAKTAAKAKAKAAPSTKRKAAARVSDPAAPQTGTRPVARTIFDIIHSGAAIGSDPSFRDAPDGWMPVHARALAAEAGLTLTDDHWEIIRVLQGCYKDEAQPRIRLLHNALEARFASKGGTKYLFGILPGGPIVQGCALAGLKPPHGARDLSFGSVA